MGRRKSRKAKRNWGKKEAGAMRTSIRFKNRELAKLRGELLRDTSREYFAVLLAKRHEVGDLRVLTVMDMRFPTQGDYKAQGGAGLRVDFDSFMRGVLVEVDERVDVDTVIDVHTHPFSHSEAWFSGIDDADEGGFALYLDRFGIGYASIVFTRTTYAARWWGVSGGDGEGGRRAEWSAALVKTQKPGESIPSPDDEGASGEVAGMFDRSVRALGLDGMRSIAAAQTVAVVGVGGLGSVIAEHLVHMGFSRLALVDFDTLEVTNMNRIVGATMEDARAGRLKVESVRDHLLAVNPDAQVQALARDVFDDEVERAIAASDWVMVATDNHASRFHVQELCFKYFVPFITAGVNITVRDGEVADVSGESILVRMGDRVCLSCLGRVNFNEVAKERHPDPAVRAGLVSKGYVSGGDVKEPAVKTLNTHLATIAVDTLVNQYTERRRDAAVTVFEDNGFPTIYEDAESVRRRSLDCCVCGI